LGLRHDGDHAWWSQRGRVAWDHDGTVRASVGMRMWWPGKRYDTGYLGENKS